METNLKGRKCEYCHRYLRVIGLQRQNGSCNYIDWSSRKFHKQCQNQVNKHLDEIYEYKK